MKSKKTHQVILFEQEYTTHVGGVDLFQYCRSWLEVLPIDVQTWGRALFVGSKEECEQYEEENYLSYQE